MTAQRTADSPQPTLDVGPVRVSGIRVVARARVIFHDDALYIAQTANNVKRYTATEPEYDKATREWSTLLDDGSIVTFTRRGCATCSWPLRHYRWRDLVAVGDGERKRATR